MMDREQLASIRHDRARGIPWCSDCHRSDGTHAEECPCAPVPDEKPEVHDPYADESTPFLFGTKWLHQTTEDKKS